MSNWESIGEWLHADPSRTITIRAAGHLDDEGNWHAREGQSSFTLTTRLPDGRKVQSSVRILDELMAEPSAGDMIVHEAKVAIDNLLNKDKPPA